MQHMPRRRRPALARAAVIGPRAQMPRGNGPGGRPGREDPPAPGPARSDPMGRRPPSTEPRPRDGRSPEAPGPGSWSRRYGERHRLHRIVEFPAGIIPPRRVRVYRRCGHYVLQWWDPAARTNLSDRVDGDLVAAIARARQIEERLGCARDAGLGRRRLGHRELVEAFLTDLGRRADAGQL